MLMAEERKMSLTPEEQSKTIVVEFHGGFRDGEILRSDSANPNEVTQCMGLYILQSQGGKIGKRMRGYSEAGIAELQELLEVTPQGPRLKREPVLGMNHIYEVVDRQEDNLSIRVRYHYM
jgi:hypothetical protein